MWTNLFIIFFCSIVLPIWLVLHYLTKWRTSRALSKEDAEILESLWIKASRMEERVEVLETILDTQSKSWRSSNESSES